MTYLAILRRPGILALVVSTTVARFPVGLNGIAIVLYVQAQLGSFALAGAVVSAVAVGTAIGGPLQSRLIDRCGVWPLFVFGAGNAIGVVMIILSSSAGAAAPVLVAVGILTGTCQPVTTSVLRSRWPYILADEPKLLTPAYALDSVLIEIAFVGGPLIAGLALALSGPVAALVLSACFVVVGTTSFTLVVNRQPQPPAAAAHHDSLLGPLASSEVRLLTAMSVPFGFYLGAVEIAMPAFAHGLGSSPLAGVFLAVFAASSTAGALVYGVARQRRSLWSLHLRFSLLLALAALPMLFAPGPWLALPLIALAGLPVAPTIATRNELVRHVAPAGTEAEAFVWPLTAMIVGISFGALVGGSLVAAHGWRGPIAAGIAVVGAATLLPLLVRPSPALLKSGEMGS